MLPERHNLCIVGSVHFIKRTSNALVSESCNVWRVGKNAPTLENNINEAVRNFDFGRNVKQLAHIIHTTPLHVGGREDVLGRNVKQSTLMVKNFGSSELQVTA